MNVAESNPIARCGRSVSKGVVQEEKAHFSIDAQHRVAAMATTRIDWRWVASRCSLAQRQFCALVPTK